MTSLVSIDTNDSMTSSGLLLDRLELVVITQEAAKEFRRRLDVLGR